ncbi:hypothetical protein [Streptomyces sp. NPDC050704]|uniref:hypothetical protein n=1 Tax=Streptomyces sp. NPDC050704 TaxID=3157219 RepID=UPI00343CA7E7
MQHSAVPELAHTHTRPIHWVATATALAGVVAASAFLQPDEATAAQHGPEAKTVPAATAPPDPARADLPIECGPIKVKIQKQASGDLDGDGRPETVAVVRCDAGSGTPPNGVYVLTQAEGATKPRVVATLVDPKDRLSVKTLTLRDAAITATVLGYSSPDVPSCCPDVNERAKWQWKNGTFVRSTPAGAQSV